MWSGCRSIAGWLATVGLVGIRPPERALRDAALQMKHLLGSGCDEVGDRAARHALDRSGGPPPRRRRAGSDRGGLFLSLQQRLPIFQIVRFVGLQNYRFLAIDPRFWNSLGNTLYSGRRGCSAGSI